MDIIVLTGDRTISNLLHAGLKYRLSFHGQKVSIQYLLSNKRVIK